MNKKTILYILLESVFLVVFNTVFFLVGGTDHPESVWISYAFIHFAYLMVIATPILTKKSSSAAVFGASLSFVSTIYFFVEFVVGLIFMLVSSDSFEASLVVQVIIAGIYAVMLLMNLIANENTANNIKQHEQEVFFIKEASSKVKLLMDKSSDKKANKEIEKLYDLLHSSPSKTHSSVQILELNIKNMILELELAITNNDVDKTIQIAQRTISIVEERNQRLRTL